MTLGAAIIFIACIVGAVYFCRKGKPGLMVPCIAIAIVMFFLLAATALLVNGID